MKRFSIALTAALVLAGATANAQPPPAGKGGKPKGEAAAPPKLRPELPVLTLASDDAEDQAEALSGALRSRLRAAPGITVDETTLNLATLTSALACGKNPDPLCLIKIGDQLKVEKFVWGTIKKGPARGQVTADVHLWRRGKPDTATNAIFSDNLRDQNDDVLRRIAGQLVDKLLGQNVAAPVTLRTNENALEVVVDGTERVSITRGEAVLELRPGRHTLEIRASGQRPETHEVEVTSTAEQVLTVRLGEQNVEPPPAKGISGRTVLAFGLIGVGAGFAVAGTLKGLEFLSLQDENKRDASALPHVKNFCDPTASAGADLNVVRAACNRLESAKDARLLGFVFGGIAAATAGTGLVLLLTDDSGKEANRTADRGQRPSPAFRVTPRAGLASCGVDLSVRF